MGYIAVALFREATRGRFKRLYKIQERHDPEGLPIVDDMEKSIQRERVQMLIDRLSWFDRTIMNLYLEGWSMVEVADSTDIGVGVLYQSLHRSRKAIQDAISNE